MSTPTKLAPAEFIEKMKSGSLSEQVTLVGMVDQDKSSEQTIRFVPGTVCQGWVDIPISLIEHISFLGNSTCQDHSHPIVEITFKDSASDESRVFTKLLMTLKQKTGSSNINAENRSYETSIPLGTGKRSMYDDYVCCSHGSSGGGGGTVIEWISYADCRAANGSALPNSSCGR